jgi:ligand-binding sensor domain-containing protein
MKETFTIVLLFICTLCSAQNKLGAIGQWRGHFDNHSVIKVIKGDKIFAASPFQIAALDGTTVINWLDKTTGLHDINISNVVWDDEQEQLVVTYSNSNIDIIKGDQIFNVNAIQLTNLYPDKKINAIVIHDNLAFLATNFGMVTIDLIKHEIKSTYFPNQQQQPTITYSLSIAKDSIYAATENGIWACTYNKGVVSNWWTRLIHLDSLSIKQLICKNNIIYGYNSNAIYQLPNTKHIYQIKNGIIRNIDSSTNNLNICIQYQNQKGALLQLNKDNTTTILIDSSYLVAPMQSVMDNNVFWVADSIAGLHYKSNNNQWISIGGTNGSLSGIMSINETNIVAPFGYKAGYSHFNESGWKSYTAIGNVNLPLLYASSISKIDESCWFTSANTILHISKNNTQIEYIKPNALAGNYKSIQADQNNSIWAIQDQQGIVRQSNNAWNNIPMPNNLNRNGLDKFIINNQQQAWMIAPNHQGIYIYQSKDVYGTEVWKQLSTSASNGNLPSTNVTSITTDKMGSIWVGTNNGIGIFNCGDIATSPCNAYLPIVNNNGFNGYLFQKELVQCITVDGANRKWIGTNNGAWLLSEDGLQIIEHFTKANSPLPTDTILQIIIDPKNGEVFFNTSNQMVSYRGTATAASKTQQSIQIFPNPIPPSFSGQVAFKGLVENAIVKITDLTGKLLYQTTALGGQAMWNARTYEGKKVATGVYLVFVRDLDGNEKGVGKIVIADGY